VTYHSVSGSSKLAGVYLYRSIYLRVSFHNCCAEFHLNVLAEVIGQSPDAVEKNVEQWYDALFSLREKR